MMINRILVVPCTNTGGRRRTQSQSSTRVILYKMGSLSVHKMEKVKKIKIRCRGSEKITVKKYYCGLALKGEIHCEVGLEF